MIIKMYPQIKIKSCFAKALFIYAGYDVVGFENIPDTGAALIIYYHAAFPIDLYYLLANIYLEKGRVIHNVVDNFVFKIPGRMRC